MSNEDQKKLADLLLVCKRTQTSRSGIQHVFHQTSRFCIFFLFKRNYFQCMQECACRRACLGACVRACVRASVRVVFRLIAKLSFVRFLIVPRFVYSQVVRLHPFTFGKNLLQPSCFSMMEMRSLVTRTTRLGHPFFFLQVIIYLPKESFASNTKWWLAIPKTFGSAH